jgi:hypothetical protein
MTISCYDHESPLSSTPKPMTEQQQHPSSPPQEVRVKWFNEAVWDHRDHNRLFGDYLIAQASRWAWDQREPEIQAAADAELEACCTWVQRYAVGCCDSLRAARRPKPPSLKECALNAHNRARCGSSLPGDSDIILHALEALDD